MYDEQSEFSYRAYLVAAGHLQPCDYSLRLASRMNAAFAAAVGLWRTGLTQSLVVLGIVISKSNHLTAQGIL